MIETRERKERVILIAVDLGDGTEVEASLAELAELADTAGAETVGTGSCGNLYWKGKN